MKLLKTTMALFWKECSLQKNKNHQCEKSTLALLTLLGAQKLREVLTSQFLPLQPLNWNFYYLKKKMILTLVK